MQTLMVLWVALSMNAPTKRAPLVGYNLPDSQLACIKIQGYYNKIKTFKANFTQVFTKRFHGAQKAERGVIYVQKPGMMAWEYRTPTKKFFIVDGKKVWSYNPAHKQALWRHISNSGLPAPVKFLWGKGDLIGTFNVKLIPKSKYGKGGLSVIKMVPKTYSPHYKSVLFVFDKNGAVRGSIVYDHHGNKNHISFSDIKLNTKISASRFRFTAPKGTQVLYAGDKTKRPKKGEKKKK